MGLNMELKNYNVASEIKDGLLLGQNFGRRASKQLMSYFESLQDNTTLLIDLTEAILLEYEFCSELLGPLIKAFKEGKYDKKYVIIKVHAYDKLNLLSGILWYVCAIKGEEDAEKMFFEKNLTVKLFDVGKNGLEYVGLRNEQHHVLNLVDEKLEITAQEIADKIDMSVEDVIEKYLKILVNQFFIYTKHKGKDVLYCSFYNIFKEKEDK
jgi:hypothetical protein